jgi:hypothetical protein
LKIFLPLPFVCKAMQHVCLQLPGFLGTALERAAQPKGQEGMGTGYFPQLLCSFKFTILLKWQRYNKCMKMK